MLLALRMNVWTASIIVHPKGVKVRLVGTNGKAGQGKEEVVKGTRTGRAGLVLQQVRQA